VAPDSYTSQGVTLVADDQEDTVSDDVPTAARLVRDFVNTYEPQTGQEMWVSGDALTDWLVGQHLVPGHATQAMIEAQPGDLTAAVTVREGLRHVLLAHAGHEPDPAAIDALRATLAELPVRVDLGPGGYQLVSTRTDPVGSALGQVLDAVRQSTADGTWPRLKVCARDTCRWAYYDASRNSVRRWCSMAGCGNYVKMRRASTVRRSRSEAAAAPPT
jgi:predicted RNA-binding Zn ribbon-like protein